MTIAPQADFDLTGLMDRDGIISVRRVSTVQGRFFEVVTEDGTGRGMTVGEALEAAQHKALAA